MRSFHDRAIHLQRQVHHGIGFIDVIGREKFMAGTAKGSLSCGNYAGILAMASGNVQKSEKHQMRSHPQEIIEVAAAALSTIDGRNLRMIKHWNRNRRQRRRGEILSL